MVEDEPAPVVPIRQGVTPNGTRAHAIMDYVADTLADTGRDYPEDPVQDVVVVFRTEGGTYRTGWLVEDNTRLNDTLAMGALALWRDAMGPQPGGPPEDLHS